MTPFPDTLRIYGNLSLLEMAPVLLAAEQIYPGKTVLAHGSVMSLWGKSSDLASLDSAGQSDLAANSETQALRAAVDHPDLRFIFTVAECPYRIVARRSAGITGLADLRGKRVGTQIDSSAAYFLDRMLRSGLKKAFEPQINADEHRWDHTNDRKYLRMSGTSEAYGTNARQHGSRAAAGWRNGRMTDPILPVLVRPQENAMTKSIAGWYRENRSRRRPFRQDPVSKRGD